MRYVIFLLMIGNLLFFAWHLNKEQQEGRQSFPAVTVTPMVDGVNRLVLLQERKQAALPKLASVDAVSMPDAPVSIVEEESAPPETSNDDLDIIADGPVEEIRVKTCNSLGPFTNADEVSKVASRLQSLGIESTQRASNVQEQVGYWVYIPAAANDEALEIVRDLDRRQIEDYYIGKNNYVSLGIYSDKMTAERRRRNIETMGYQPRLNARFRATTVYWLDFVEPEAREVTIEDWQGLMSDFPGVLRQSIACE